MDRLVAITALLARVAIAFKGGQRCDGGLKDCLGQVGIRDGGQELPCNTCHRPRWHGHG